MAVDLEWYLKKLYEVAQEEDVDDASHRARIQWYIDLTVKKLSREDSGTLIEERRDVLSHYMFTCEGRDTWAVALNQPGLDQYNSIKSLIGTNNDPWHELVRIKRLLIEYDNFFSILTEPERFTPAVCALRAIARDLYDLYETIDGAIPPGVTDGDDARKTAGDPGLSERFGDDLVPNGDVHLTESTEEDDQGAPAD
jgi:hypothetical protein